MALSAAALASGAATLARLLNSEARPAEQAAALAARLAAAAFASRAGRAGPGRVLAGPGRRPDCRHRHHQQPPQPCRVPTRGRGLRSRKETSTIPLCETS